MPKTIDEKDEKAWMFRAKIAYYPDEMGFSSIRGLYITLDITPPSAEELSARSRNNGRAELVLEPLSLEQLCVLSKIIHSNIGLQKGWEAERIELPEPEQYPNKLQGRRQL